MESKRTIEELKLLQNLPLEIKIAKTKLRIREWVDMYGVSGVYVSFSGGKDSTVLLHIVREMYPDVEAVFVNTGLEYPEIQQFVKTFDNVTTLRPKMRFDEVIKKYGYPLISKEVSKTVSAGRRLDSKFGVLCRERLNGTELQKSGKKSLYNCPKYKPLLDVEFEVSNRCCDVMKKTPSHDYGKKTGKVAITGQMADESRLRETTWIKNGCNSFDAKNPVSNPMSFWTEQDVLRYIKENNIKIASVYGEIEYADKPEQMRLWNIDEPLKTSGCQRTGCIFCAFGCHLEKEPSRFQLLKQTHPKQYAYCIGGGEFNEQGIWQPSKEGLGMGYVFDRMNEIYGEDFIKYK